MFFKFEQDCLRLYFISHFKVVFRLPPWVKVFRNIPVLNNIRDTPEILGITQELFQLKKNMLAKINAEQNQPREYT